MTNVCENPKPDRDEVMNYVEEKLDWLFNYLAEEIKGLKEDDPLLREKLDTIKGICDYLVIITRFVVEQLRHIRSERELLLFAKQLTLTGLMQGQQTLAIVDNYLEEDKE